MMDSKGAGETNEGRSFDRMGVAGGVLVAGLGLWLAVDAVRVPGRAGALVTGCSMILLGCGMAVQVRAPRAALTLMGPAAALMAVGAPVMPAAKFLILAFFLSIMAVGGWIGGFVAGRYGRDRRTGFLLGALGGMGGWILAAVYPRNRLEMRGVLTRARVLACASVGLVAACANAWGMAAAFLVVAWPERFGPLLLR